MYQEVQKMSNKTLFNHLTQLPTTQKMPVLFLGHGSPMNAISKNEFTETFRNLGKNLPHPQAVLCISAHWETQGTWLTAMEKPKTIHDFYGFPDILNEMQYPAAGSPVLAESTQNLFGKQGAAVQLDTHWGLDHGTWSVLTHLYPNADVPVVQLSLDRQKTPEQHYALAQLINTLRYKGVLILGSGNIVHNLGRVAMSSSQNYGYSWALEAQETVNALITQGNHDSLIKYKDLGQAVHLAVPTPEHFLPLLYVLAQQDKQDELTLFNDEAVMGSLTMTSVLLF